MDTNRDGFTSKFGVIAAAAGSAVGLGNIWRFPYLAGENGGGAFLLIYLFFVLAIGVPVMLSELMIGRKAQRNIFGAFRELAPRSLWPVVGMIGVAAAFMILAFYAVVAGWTIEYFLLALKNEFAGKTPGEIKALYSNFTSDTWKQVVYMLLFMLGTALIVRNGIRKGIEKYSKIMMPLLLVIILTLCVRSLTLDGALLGLRFFLMPDFSQVDADLFIAALGQAFFSLSLGMGVMATYGSYIKKSESLGRTAISVSLTDTLVAILAGVVIFPAAFAFGIQPDAGPSLLFVTLPGLFNQMPAGFYFAILFFILLIIAALTSSISLLEVVVAYFTEELKLKRSIATFIAAGMMSALGILCAASDKIFSFFDKTSSNILLPLGGLLIVIFAGWFLGLKVVRDELEADGREVKYFTPFVIVIKFLAPVAIAVVFLKSLGLLEF